MRRIMREYRVRKVIKFTEVIYKVYNKTTGKEVQRKTEIIGTHGGYVAELKKIIVKTLTPDESLTGFVVAGIKQRVYTMSQEDFIHYGTQEIEFK